jgi:hypothetical protein
LLGQAFRNPLGNKELVLDHEDVNFLRVGSEFHESGEIVSALVQAQRRTAKCVQAD